MANILYRLTFPNGKIYIGQTVRSMKARFSHHKACMTAGSTLPVHCAWRKYGEPSVSIIGEYDSKEALDAAEIQAIASQDCRIPNGYNIAFGGTGTGPTAPETRKKISDKAKGRKIDNSARRKEIARELWQSEEYRENIGKSLKAKWQDPEFKAMMSAKRKEAWAKRKADGWVMPEETKAKLKQKVFSEETRAKMSEAAKKRVRAPASEETRAKLSERTKAAWQNEELTLRRVAAIKAASKRKDGAAFLLASPHFTETAQ